jgi:hypothetical protein
MVKKAIGYLLLYWVSCMPTFAQENPWSCSAGSGVLQYLGDLSASPFSSEKTLHPYLYVAVNHQLTAVIGSSLGFMRGRVSAADSLIGKKELRNAHFRSPITDFHFLIDVDLQEAWRGFRRKSGLTKRLDHLRLVSGPKLIFGIGYFHFNPEAQYAGKWYRLQPLGTEGQRTALDYPSPYRLWQMNLKVGGELGFQLNRRWRLDVFGHYTLLFTDYLDDVGGTYADYNDLAQLPNGELVTNLTYRRSNGAIAKKGTPRANPETNDRYVNLGLKLRYTIGRGELKQMRL